MISVLSRFMFESFVFQSERKQSRWLASDQWLWQLYLEDNGHKIVNKVLTVSIFVQFQ